MASQAGIAESKASILQKGGRGAEAIKILAVAAAKHQNARDAAEAATKLQRDAEAKQKVHDDIEAVRLAALKHISAASRIQELSKVISSFNQFERYLGQT